MDDTYQIDEIDHPLNPLLVRCFSHSIDKMNRVDRVGSSRVAVGSAYEGDIDDKGNFTPS